MTCPIIPAISINGKNAHIVVSEALTTGAAILRAPVMAAGSEFKPACF